MIDNGEQNLFATVEGLEAGRYALIKIEDIREIKKRITPQVLDEIESHSKKFLESIFGKGISVSIIGAKSRKKSHVIEISCKDQAFKRLIGRNGNMGNALRLVFSGLSEEYEGSFVLEFKE